MGDLDRQLDRLGRGWRATRGRALVGRGHLMLLTVLVLAALGWRWFGVPQVMGLLEGRWVLVLALAAFLVMLGPALALVVPRLIRVPRRTLARSLDDAMAWQDALDTALDVPEVDPGSPVETFLVVQSTGRLRGLEPKRLWPHRARAKWVPRILAFLFAAILLLPGFRGGLGQRGAGAGDEAAIGQQAEPRPADPSAVDVWLLTHVQEPLPAEPLLPEESEEAAAGDEQATARGGDER